MHCTAVTANLAGLMSLPESYVAAKSAHILAGMLSRGFTTIRDAGTARAVRHAVHMTVAFTFSGGEVGGALSPCDCLS